VCIAIYVPNGVEPPTKEILKRCFKNNSDGAGFGWYNKKEKTWIVSKGHMSFKKFWKAFQAKKFKDNTEIMIHFRIGTSGRKSHPDCTHPFPVSENFKDMTLAEYKSDNIVMHNGVIGLGEGNASDTMVAIRDYIEPMYPYMEDNKIVVILKELIETTRSRWLLARKDEVVLLGGWQEEDGISYSNAGYKPVVKRVVEGVRGVWSGYYNRGRHIPEESGIETGYDWMPKDMEVLHSIYSFDDYAVNGVWQWTLFEKYLIERGKQLDQAAGSYTKGTLFTKHESDDGSGIGDIDHNDADDIYEVFDQDGEIIAAVDDHGDIIWDEPDNLVHDNSSMKPCPNCPEEKNIVDSPYSCGDNMCCRCGAVYIKGLQGDESILMWDIDIQRHYLKTLRIMAEGV